MKEEEEEKTQITSCFHRDTQNTDRRKIDTEEEIYIFEHCKKSSVGFFIKSSNSLKMCELQKFTAKQDTFHLGGNGK